MEKINHTKKIVLFDGDCGLCNRSVKLILKKEKNHELLFSPLQSEFSQQKLREFHLVGKVESIVYLNKNKALIKSTAALHLCLELRGIWPLLFGFIIVPKFIRDIVYDYIARNRIKWFGNADYCDIITPELEKRFIE